MGLTYLPSNVLEKMSMSDRKEYALHVGIPNAGKTRSDIERELALKAERDLQSEIRQYLELREIIFINPAIFRKSQLPVGWPDFSFAFCGIPILWETKSLQGKLRENQASIVAKLVRNGWRFRLIRSVEAARNHLRDIELERRGV
jgi:hypothetical protein